MTTDTFTTRVRAAAIAGWWTLLVAVALAVLVWAGYLRVMTNQPAWVLRLWGPGLNWSDLQRIFLWVIVVLRFVVWLILLSSLWLTLWARQLRRLPPPPCQ